MRRRLLAAMLAVTATVVLGVAVPLGVVAVHREKAAYRESVTAACDSLAALAEEQLADEAKSAPTLAVRRGDSAAFVDDRGAVSVAGPDGARLRPGASPDGLVVAQVVVRDAEHRFGTLVVARPRRPLDDKVRELVVAIIGAAVLAIGLAAAVSLALARWVAGPVSQMAAVALRLGDGELGERASTTTGPSEVRALAAELNAMAERITSLVSGQRDMLADVSHQLRTPLSALQLRLENLAAEAGDADAADELRAALDEVGRLARLVDGLLAVARAENASTAPETLDLADVVGERIRAWAPVAAEREALLGKDDWPRTLVVATPGHLEQTLDNLLANALEAVPRGGEVRLSVESLPDALLLYVDDSGPGMPAAAMAAAFERFSTDRAANGGTGLGLAVAHRLTTVDGGRLELSRSPLGGLRATVVLHPAA